MSDDAVKDLVPKVSPQMAQIFNPNAFSLIIAYMMRMSEINDGDL